MSTLILISEVEMTWMLTPFSPSALNIVWATPVWLLMPTPITETLATLSSSAMSSKPILACASLISSTARAASRPPGVSFAGRVGAGQTVDGGEARGGAGAPRCGHRHRRTVAGAAAEGGQPPVAVDALEAGHHRDLVRRQRRLQLVRDHLVDARL